MISFVLLSLCLIITSWTDLRDGKIYNWATYPGILIAIGINGSASLFDFVSRWGDAEVAWWWGTVGFGESLLGMLSCGGAMLVCYVFFAGQIGGGDLKLIAMIGAFLGVMKGLEAMLWAFVIAAAVAVIRLIWQIGITRWVTQTWRVLLALVRFRTLPRLSDEERQPLQASLCLSPSAFAAVLIVEAEFLMWWWREWSQG